jgi:hypothetical protein
MPDDSQRTEDGPIMLNKHYFAGQENGVARERARCASIVRAKQSSEPRLWWLRDELETIAKDIENG